MQTEIVKFFENTSYLSPENVAYIEELSELPEEWRNYFDRFFETGKPTQEPILSDIRQKFISLGKNASRPMVASGLDFSAMEQIQKQASLEFLIQAYRQYGHFQAHLDPLGLSERYTHPALLLEKYGLSEKDMDTVFEPTSFQPRQKETLRSLLARLNSTYSGSIGAEYTYITEENEMLWIQKKLESVQSSPSLDIEKKTRILRMLIWAEEFERFLGSKYVGQTRFSLEGGSSLIPLLDELIQCSGKHGVNEVITGMGHRGRLNILVNVLGMPLDRLFLEFAKKPQNGDRSGDVKYHTGFSSNIKIKESVVHTALAFNPSHLEIIDPVVVGAVRARQDRRRDKTRNSVIPILIHGDAAFAGQGVVMETFNLSQTRGFTTGGTIHIVVNNQIGFTTSNKHDSRSSWYSTDIAKMIGAPVFHVNGDDPEAVVFIAQLALEYRLNFNKDVVIDLICYRRLGHNEADEPSATQPVMYQIIRKHPRTWERYVEFLKKENSDFESKAQEEISKYRKILDDAGTLIETVSNEMSGQSFAEWRKYKDQVWNKLTDTTLMPQELQEIGRGLLTLPNEFKLQPQVLKEYENRQEMLQGSQPFNWGFAESLALGSLLKSGFSVRFSGQDCGRGTFSHRHAVLHDQITDKIYIPLSQMPTELASFSIFDSTLSEEAVLGFEYGFSATDAETLVIWEAQYGDFVNGAQVVIDQFIASCEQKWSRLSGLVMFLPHGYEGAGPEHSSARLERFLQACAQKNIQVCIPSTPAQVFHMLRRQMIRPYRKPLIVMMPKSLLRNKLATSQLEDFTQGQFKLLISEIDDIPPNKCQKVILCSGKVYYDLLKQRRENQQNNIAIIRLEQLYPFPKIDLTTELAKYSKTNNVFWCQEEPQNQGAWHSISHRLLECLAPGQTLGYLGRPASASPATGYSGVHQEEQAALVAQALTL
jgi:2-oxoglutarate dehydrogenase E1 component